MNQYFQDGRYIDYTPEADVAAGTFVRIGNITGFANLDIKAGVKGALCTEGVIKVEKATGTAISAGAKVYWGGESKAVTTAGATYIGVAIAEAASADTFVLVKLNIGVSEGDASASA